MPKLFNRAAVCLLAAATVTLLPSCKSTTSNDKPSGAATSIDAASVATGINEVSTVIPICRKSGGQEAAVVDGPAIQLDSWAERFLELATDQTVRIGLNLGKLTSTKPADQFGDCGGRITYPTYSHSNGTTTGTYAFENYCSIDNATGERTTSNGSITFKDSGTPSASGPITNKVEASSQSGITTTTKSSTGTTLESHKITFENLVFVPGVPGGTPTSSKPDQVTVDQISNANLISGKTYRQTNLKTSSYETSSGGQSATLTGRGYRSNGEYFDITTSTAVTTSSSGAYTGGQLTFKGANNSTAVVTVVPGSTLQGTMTVNGQPVTSVPICK
jgi:hypothetical protein